jgi:hypothetical protein
MSRNAMVLLLAATASWASVAQTASAQAANDPIIGVWALNVERSVYSPGPRPPSDLVSLRHYVEMDGGWIRFTNTSVNAQGEPTFGMGVFKVDGQRHPAHNIQTLALMMTKGQESNITRWYRRIDARTVEFITYTDGVASLPSVRAVSADGMTFTETTRGTNAQGVAVNNVIVWDRVR